MIYIFDKHGEKVAFSKNLRVILRYARDVSPVLSAHIQRESSGRYPVDFEFMNGAVSTADFLDWRVAADWLVSRRRSWGLLVAALGADGVTGHPEAVKRYYHYTARGKKED